jgi:hypothetical protein
MEGFGNRGLGNVQDQLKEHMKDFAVLEEDDPELRALQKDMGKFDPNKQLKEEDLDDDDLMAELDDMVFQFIFNCIPIKSI